MSSGSAQGAGDHAHVNETPSEALFLESLQQYFNFRRQRRQPEPAAIEAWKRFEVDYLPLLRQWVQAIMGPSHDPRDDIQDLLVALIEAAPRLRFDPELGHLRGLLWTIAHRHLLRKRRRLCRFSVQELSKEEGDALPSHEPDPLAEHVRRWERTQVLEAMAELRTLVSERDYDAFRRFWLEGLHVSEVVELLGVNEGQVWSINHRLKAKLREILTHRLGQRFFD